MFVTSNIYIVPKLRMTTEKNKVDFLWNFSTELPFVKRWHKLEHVTEGTYLVHAGDDCWREKPVQSPLIKIVHTDRSNVYSVS